MPLYDFLCQRSHVTESIQPMDRSVIVCPVCLSPANRQAANRVTMAMPEVDKRGMFRRFQEASQEIDHAAARQEQSTGQAIQTPNYWGAAKERAKRMIAAGEAPATRKD